MTYNKSESRLTYVFSTLAVSQPSALTDDSLICMCGIVKWLWSTGKQ